MDNFTIVTDSSCNLPDTLLQQFGIRVISLTFSVGEQQFCSYTPEQFLDLKQFYASLRKKENVCTSSVSPEACRNVFKAELENDHDILYMGFSSGLSATYETAHAVLLQLMDEYPMRKIRYVDTLAAALGQGRLVVLAAQLRAQGKSLDETADWVLKNRLQQCHLFTVGDLFFLFRGGRVSRTAAVLGTMAGVKPILCMDHEGHLVVTGKVRGRRASLDALIKQFGSLAVEPAAQTVYIVHGDCETDALYVKHQIASQFRVHNFVIALLEPVIGGHSGPDTVGIFFSGTARSSTF